MGEVGQRLVLAALSPAVPRVEALPREDEVRACAVVADVVVQQVFASDVTRSFSTIPAVAPVAVVDLEEAEVLAAVGVHGAERRRVARALVLHEAHPVGQLVLGEVPLQQLVVQLAPREDDRPGARRQHHQGQQAAVQRPSLGCHCAGEIGRAHV